MDIVSRWLEERSKNKLVTQPRNQTTNVSSPLRGANQDYSGVGVKNDNADYTISDEHKHPNLNVPPHQPEWEIETKTTRKAISKHLMKTTSKGVYGEEVVNEISKELVGRVNRLRALGPDVSKGTPPTPHKTKAGYETLKKAVDKAAGVKKAKEYTLPRVEEEAINELISGVGDVRIKPVNMGQQSGKEASANAPSNVYKMQSAADKRVAQLDRAAQQQKDQSKKNQEKQIADREKAAAQRQKESRKQMKESNMKTFKDFFQLNEATRMNIIKTASKQAAIKAGVKVIPPKKPAKENPIKLREEDEIDEGRNPSEDNPNTGNGRDPRQHIQVQAGRAMAGVPVDFKHDNGETSKLTAPMGRKIVSHLNGLKPADRQAAVNKMHASPAGLKV